MMSRNSWIRRAATVAAAAALTMAFQPPAALAAPTSERYQSTVTQSKYSTDTKYSSHTKYYKRSKYSKRPKYRTRSTNPTAPVAPPVAPAPVAPPAPPAPPTSTQTGTAARIFELTNAQRRQAGLQPLRSNECLTRSAQSWSDQMSRERRMYHSNLGTWMNSCNLSSAGENVAMGGRSAEQTVQMWMDSPGHRANILNPRFTQLAVGWNETGAYATQQFGS